MLFILFAIMLFIGFDAYQSHECISCSAVAITQKNKNLCLFASIVWILLSGFRHVSIGSDTYAYGLSFEKIENKSWSNLLNTFIDRYTGKNFSKDPGYSLLEKAVRVFVKDYQMFLILIAIFFFVSMGIWIYRNSRMPLISFVLFSCLFYSFYAFTGHRQTIATAIVVFIGNKYIRERKLIKFLLCIAIAMTIHSSSVCYLPAFFIYPIKNYGRKGYITALCIGLVLLLVADPLWNWVATTFHYEDFLTNDIGGTGTFVFLYLVIVIAVILQLPLIVRNNPNIYGALNLTLFGAFMVVMAYVNQSFMRVQQYYTLSLMLILPELVLSFTGENRRIVKITGIGLLIFLLIKNNPDYAFFWMR